MNKILVTTATVIALFISVQVSFAAQISVAPSHKTVLKGENFSVNISVDPEESEVFGAQYVLHFNNTLLNATDQKRGPFLSQDGANTNVHSNEINNTIGQTRYGKTRMYVDHGITTQGVLATVSFTAMEPGMCSLNLTKVKLTKPDTQPIPDVLVNNGTCEIEAVEQTSTQTPTSGGDDDGNGGASETSTPTPSPGATPTKTSVTSPDSTITPASTPTQISTVAPSPSLSPVVTSSPTPTATMLPSEENNRLPGFEAAFAVIGLLAISYLILKREGMKK